MLPPEEKAKKTGKYKASTVTAAQLREIAQKKINDLNARDLEHAMRIVEGTARSMGIKVVG
jgi:large subunit ribosomal protein L11